MCSPLFLITSSVGVRFWKKKKKRKKQSKTQVLCTATSEYAKDEQKEGRCHIWGQEATVNTHGVCVFHHPMSVGEWRNIFFLPFAHRAKLKRQADITLQSQDPTFAMCIGILIFLGSYWQKEWGGWGRVCRSTGARWDPGSIMHTKRMRLSIYWVFMLQNRKCGAPLLKLTDC